MSGELVLRTSLVLAVTWLLCRLLRRATPATRHLLWHSAIAFVLAAPIVLWLVPPVPLPLQTLDEAAAVQFGLPRRCATSPV